MPKGRYLVSVNGFRCNRQSWDDALNWDGKADEVYIAIGRKIVDKTGTILDSQDPVPTPVMGDTWNQPNRIQAGRASSSGGIITGDPYPTMAPWMRSRPLDDTQDWPPYKVWEGDLTEGEDVVFITPTIWEWDPGTSFWDTVLAWHVAVDAQFGQRAKDVFAGRWPAVGWWFDAISLGIQTAGTLRGIWGGLGRSGNRPIGTMRDPNNAGSNDAVLFNPQVLMLTYHTAELLTRTDPFGRGNGILIYRYADDNYLAGDFNLYLQVEKVSASILEEQGDWRWCHKCQGLFFSGGQSFVGSCPAGGQHEKGVSSNYTLAHNSPSAPGQPDWRWCHKCYGLFFSGGYSYVGSCPAGGQHERGWSGNYTLAHNSPGAPDQSDWRWCHKCYGLFFSGGQSSVGSCPAGGQHEKGVSGNYTLMHTPA